MVAPVAPVAAGAAAVTDIIMIAVAAADAVLGYSATIGFAAVLQYGTRSGNCVLINIRLDMSAYILSIISRCRILMDLNETRRSRMCEHYSNRTMTMLSEAAKYHCGQRAKR